MIRDETHRGLWDFMPMLAIGFLTCIGSAVAGVWTAQAPMNTARDVAAGGVINGKLYVAGGAGPLTFTPMTTLEEYNPATNSWTTRNSDIVARYGAAAGVINGKLYVAGGETVQGTPALTSVTEYDPVFDIWIPKTPMPVGAALAACAVINNKLYVAGGRSNTSALNSCYEYDPVGDSWSTKASLPSTVHSTSGGALNGKLYVVGGIATYVYSGTSLAAVRVYDPVGDSWSTGPPLPRARFGATVVSHSNRLFVLGGYMDSYDAQTAFDELDLVTNSWKSHPHMPIVQSQAVAAIIGGKVYIGSGESGGISLFTTMLNAYDLSEKPQPPVLVSASRSGVRSLDVTFSELMHPSAQTPSNYTISGAGAGSLTANPTSVSWLAENTYRLSWSIGSGGVTNDNTQLQLTASASLMDATGQSIATPRDMNLFTGGTSRASFSVASALPAGDSPTCVVSADFNRDGNVDIVYGYLLSNTVSVRLGAGNGSFGGATDFNAGSQPAEMATADFNRDGRLDLAVTNSSAATVSVVLGDGAGGFAAPTGYAVGSGPDGVTVGDVNADGLLDLLVANFNDANFSVLPGNGSGGFGSAANYPTGLQPRRIVLGEFNGDKKIDAAISCYVGNQVVLKFGTGTGAFTGLESLNPGSTLPYGLCSADFNADGYTDLATANVGGGVSVFLGTDRVLFSSPVTYPAGTIPVQLVPGDFNGDSFTDLAVTNYSGNSVSILAGNGTGAFDDPVITSFGSSPRGIASADFDRDGDLDLAVSSESDDTVGVLRNTRVHGSVLFPSFQSMPAGGLFPHYSASGDFNSDGKPDVVVVNRDSDNVSVFVGDGHGSFSSAGNCGVQDEPRGILVVDLNRDRKPDLVVTNANSASMSVLLGVGTGSFGAAANTAVGSSPDGLATGDFNRDGIPDVAIAIEGASQVKVGLGSGNGGFSSFNTYTAGTNGTRGVATGDFNGDGLLDLAVTEVLSNKVHRLSGNGDGTFNAAAPFNVGSNPTRVVAADFNRDGRLDLATGNVTGNNVSVLIGDGAGSFAAAVNYAVGWSPQNILARDLDRDGIQDILVANQFATIFSPAATVSFLKGIGNGNFATAVHYTGTDSPLGLVAEDINQDGWLDFVTPDAGTNVLSVGLNRGGQFALVTTSTAPIAVPSNTIDDVLKVVCQHRGITGDADIELAGLHLQFDSGGPTPVPLTNAQAGALIEELRVVEDTNLDGIWQPGETVLTTHSNLGLDTQGRLFLNFPDGFSNSATPFGTMHTYFVVLKTRPDAASQIPLGVRITHVTSSSSIGEDPNGDGPLRLEYAPDVNTPTTPLPVSISAFGLE